jgi:phage shock protein A
MGRLNGFSKKLKSLGTALFSPAEDPRTAYTFAFDRQRELLSKVQAALAAVGATKERLETKAAAVRAKLPQLEGRAAEALQVGREDMARLALQRRHLAALELQTLERQLLEIEHEEHRLSLTEQRLSTQLETFFARQEMLAARYSAAEAQVQIGEALSGVSDELAELDQAMQQAERKSALMQARAAAIDRLVDDGLLELPGSASDELMPLDVSRAVEDQLATLKARLALPAADAA